MQAIFDKIWGQTKLTRTALALTFAVGAVVGYLQEIPMPDWYVGMLTLTVGGYFITRSAT